MNLIMAHINHENMAEMQKHCAVCAHNHRVRENCLEFMF